MDEQEYRETYHSVNPQRCVFEKAILTRRFGCEKLVKINIAEREAASCTDENANHQCEEVLCHLRRMAGFALKIPNNGRMPLPHAKEVKAQCGGMLGLYQCLHPDAGTVQGVDNLHGLVRKALAAYTGTETFPDQEIVKTIGQFEGRRKRSPRGV